MKQADAYHDLGGYIAVQQALNASGLTQVIEQAPGHLVEVADVTVDAIVPKSA